MAKLYFRYGSMNCGKSTQLIQVAYNYEEKNKKVLLIKPSSDTKGEDYVMNRSNLKRKVDLLLTSTDLVSNHLDVPFELSAILIDEAQFLTKEQVNDVYEITKLLNIPVLCYGLRCDFKMNGFPGATRLLEIADSIEELKNICSCGSKATQNLRMINNIPIFDGDQIAIDNGGKATYESLCGKCYLETREKYDKNFKINSAIKALIRKRSKNERTNN